MFAAPPVIETKILVDINAAFGITDRQSEWAKLLFGRPNTPSFLEGPSFDRDGNLWLVDVAWGRLFRVSPSGALDVACQYDGEPNGLAFHRDGYGVIADHYHGLMRLDPASRAVEPLLLFTILLAGLNKVDFYHMLYIPLFVGYLIFPKGESGAKHKCISTFLVVWSFSFLLAKQAYALIGPFQDTPLSPEEELTKEFLQAVGVATETQAAGTPWKLFYYAFWPQQWAVLVAAHLHAFLIEFCSGYDEFKVCSEKAETNLKTRFPRINSMFMKLYNLKRNIVLLVIFAVFYYILLARHRSLIFWGFQILSLVLIYV